MVLENVIMKYHCRTIKKHYTVESLSIQQEVEIFRNNAWDFVGISKQTRWKKNKKQQTSGMSIAWHIKKKYMWSGDGIDCLLTKWKTKVNTMLQWLHKISVKLFKFRSHFQKPIAKMNELQDDNKMSVTGPPWGLLSTITGLNNKSFCLLNGIKGKCNTQCPVLWSF